MRSMVPGTLRWTVDVSAWNPLGLLEGPECSFLLSLLDDDERASAIRYVQPPDQKRAIISRLLAKRASNVCLGIEFSNVVIRRTKGKKPFCANMHRDLPSDGSLDNFNFNASHEGDLVVLAAEGRACVVGVDCAAPQQIRQMRRNTKSFEEFAKNFDNVFTAEEWSKVHGAGPRDDQKEDKFRLHWSCKEAFVKARGDGLGFDLGRCSFRCDEVQLEDGGAADEDDRFFQCRLLVDGVQRDDWMLFSHRLKDGHYCTIARGPPSDIIDAWGEFTTTLRRLHFDQDEWLEAITAPSPPFQAITVADLVPKNLRQMYEEAGGTEKPTGIVDVVEAWHRARRSSSYDLASWEAQCEEMLYGSPAPADEATCAREEELTASLRNLAFVLEEEIEETGDSPPVLPDNACETWTEASIREFYRTRGAGIP